MQVMLKKLAFPIYILLIMAVTSCNYIPQSDYNNLLAEYNKVLEEKIEFELKCDNLTQQIKHTKQELDATKGELVKVQIQLEEIQSALEDEMSKEAYILKPPATLPEEMTLEPYGLRVWRYLDEKRSYNLGIQIKQFEESPNTVGVSPWFTIELLDGLQVHIPRQEAWELYKLMKSCTDQGRGQFDKLVQLGCIPCGSQFIPEDWIRNEYFHWNAISPECLAWMELNRKLADERWIARKYLEMIKKESDILYDIIMSEGYGAYENAIKSVNKNN